ncbi:pathogenesis-related protein pr-1 [Phtheirospermum japonicum]|uniref:Pathogenesis-related protein pr-1 n=1 Tax=Phtheirospermum japonicum TaxID=374723 RepID=A0A830CGM4_9LAMI|nr:pathogenesis-related protein pr-1 [Phtheirospermum japonicum]
MINACCLSILILLLTAITTTNAATAAARPNEMQQFMGVQNAARAALRLQPLAWDPRIARYAAWYANQRRFDCALEHSNGPYGENIFWGSGDGWTAAQAAAAWVSERRGYSYRSNACASGQECGHYTQIVWRGTTKIGCARVICYGGKGVFMTCNYNPPGNYIGEKPY